MTQVSNWDLYSGSLQIGNEKRLLYPPAAAHGLQPNTRCFHTTERRKNVPGRRTGEPPTRPSRGSPAPGFKAERAPGWENQGITGNSPLKPSTTEAAWATDRAQTLGQVGCGFEPGATTHQYLSLGTRLFLSQPRFSRLCKGIRFPSPMTAAPGFEGLWKVTSPLPASLPRPQTKQGGVKLSVSTRAHLIGHTQRRKGGSEGKPAPPAVPASLQGSAVAAFLPSVRVATPRNPGLPHLAGAHPAGSEDPPDVQLFLAVSLGLRPLRLALVAPALSESGGTRG